MPKNINEFKEFVEFVSNKVQSGNTITIPQFNELANRAQLQPFEYDYKVFLDTKFVTAFFTTFMKNKSLLINSIGEADMPDDYQYAASMRSYYVSGVPGDEPFETMVKWENNIDWGRMQASQLFVPDPLFPKYSEFGSKLRFLPRDLGVAQLDYFKTPIKPIWNYTVVSGEAVYNPIGSVDFEWDDFATNRVAAAYLALIGVNLKDGELEQFALMYEKQTTE